MLFLTTGAKVPYTLAPPTYLTTGYSLVNIKCESLPLLRFASATPVISIWCDLPREVSNLLFFDVNCYTISFIMYQCSGG